MSRCAIRVADLSKTPLLIQRKSKIDDKKSCSRFAFKHLKEKKNSYFLEKNRSVVFDIVYRTKYDKIVLVGRSEISRLTVYFSLSPYRKLVVIFPF